MKDASIIRHIKEGRQSTYRMVFDKYKNLIFYICFDILNNRIDAEDVTQNVFLEFFNNIDSVYESTNLKLYLATLAKRRAIDMYRKNISNPVMTTSDTDLFGKEDERIKSVITLDGYLKDDEAHIVILRAIYDYSFKEIASEMNMTIGVIQHKYYAALKQLRKHYQKGE